MSNEAEMIEPKEQLISSGVLEKLDRSLKDEPISPDHVYETLIEDLSPQEASKLLVKDFGEVGAKKLSEKLASVLPDSENSTNYVALLLDPALATKIDAFCDFYSQLETKPTNPLQARKAFIDSFAKNPITIYRSVAVSDQVRDSILQNGFSSGMTRSEISIESRLRGGFNRMLQKHLNGATKSSSLISVSRNRDLTIYATKDWINIERQLHPDKQKQVFRIEINPYYIINFRDYVDLGKKYTDWPERYWDEGLFGPDYYFIANKKDGSQDVIHSYDAESYVEYGITPINSKIQLLGQDQQNGDYIKGEYKYIKSSRRDTK